MKCELSKGELILEPEDGTEEYFLITCALAGVKISGVEGKDDNTRLTELRIGRLD